MINNFKIKPYHYSYKAFAPSFGTNAREYEIGDSYMATNSWMFREDMDWKRLVKYLDKHFNGKNNIKVLNPACSDGSEAYTLIIALKEGLQDKAGKFFPIKGYDIDDEILKAANSGKIQTCGYDRMMIQTYADFPEDYLAETPDVLRIANDLSLNAPKTFKTTGLLTNSVSFEKRDMWKVIGEHLDNSDTVFMCRNVLGHFDNDKIEDFVKLASKRLKKDSLFLIGDHDTKNTPVEEYLEGNGFVKVFHNVYKRI